jgi:DNA-binding SARP family transcriptional activator
MVVENAGAISDASTVTNILMGWAGASCDRRAVLVWHGRLPRRVRRTASVVFGTEQLAIDPARLHEAVTAVGVLSISDAARLLRATRGRAAVVHDVLQLAERAPGPAYLREMVDGCARPRALMDQLARRLLCRCSVDEQEAISIAVALGYWHPTMDRIGLRGNEVWWPWFGALEAGWWRLQPHWRRVLCRHLKSAGRWRQQRTAGAEDHKPYDREPPAPTSPLADSTDLSRRRSPNAEPPDFGAAPEPEAPTDVELKPVAVTDSRSALPGDWSHPPHVVRAYLLGGFELAINDATVGTWDSPRGLALLKYLLVHRDRPCSRDVLIDVFWPDVAPEQARNRFHVALSALRRGLRSFVETPVIVFEAGSYGLNPELDLRVDVDEFEKLLREGERALANGSTDRAIASYRQAVSLYRGDLLAESPYEDWTMLARETLRVAYLDLLDRLAALHLTTQQIGPCIAVAQLILQQDPCREDAHRLLMRCYARQGRVNEAARQYSLCTRILAANLDSVPSSATVELYRAIRTNGAD